MPGVWSKLMKRHDDFFTKEFVSEDTTLNFEMESGPITTHVSQDGDEKNIKVVAGHKFDFDGKKIEAKVSVRSSGKHTLDVGHKADFGAVKTYIREKFHFDAQDKTSKNKFSINSLLKDHKLRHKIEFLCQSGNKCTVRNDLAYQLCEKHTVAGNIGYDVSGKQITDTQFGFFGKVKDAQLALGMSWKQNEDGKEAKKLFKDSIVHWKMLFQSTKDTQVGFNYEFNPCCGSNDVTVGFSTLISENLSAKAKLSQQGHIDASFKAKLNDDWNLITSTGLDASALHGKSQVQFGFSLVGKI